MPVRQIALAVAARMVLVSALLVPTAAFAASVTVITVKATPASPVASGKATTLSASVTVSTAAVTKGTVQFNDGKKILGTAQIVNTGTARIHNSAYLPIILGPGSHSITATFLGTTNYAPSTSAALAFAVTSASPITTTLSSTPGSTAGTDYLTATLATTSLALPTAAYKFVDQTNANYVVATAPLSTPAIGFSVAATSTQFASPSHDYYLIGDFNQDGIPDIATVDSPSSSLNIALGNGSGGSTAAPGSPIALAGISFPNVLALGDFNSDGIPDLVITTGPDYPVTRTQFYVYLGSGNGSFTQATGSPFTFATVENASYPLSIVVGDFNRDGNLDIAEAETLPTFGDPEGTTDDLNILLGNGQGGFTLTPQSPLSAQEGNDDEEANQLLIGDFNGDGIMDLVTCDAEDYTLSVLLGKGDGTFGTQVITTLGDPNTPQSMAVGDFNGDGKTDLVTASDSDGNVTVLIGKGDGTFNTPQVFPQPGYSSVAVADFNGDGNLDIVYSAVATSGGIQGPAIGILLGDGTGQFTPATGSPFPSAIDFDYLISVTDFNGDGTPDIAGIVNADPTDTVQLILTHQTLTASAATPQVTIPGAGSHQLVATYPGDSSYAASTSTAISLVGAATVTALALAANPATGVTTGQSVTLTATVAPATVGSLTATGTVAFSTSATNLGSAALVSGTATITTTALPIGTDLITAKYSGDTNFAASSATLSETVTSATVATAPKFSIAAGTYSTAQTVTITDTTAGATIYYTTNGTNPTPASPKYTAPITVSATETIKALATAPGFTNSAVAAATYTITLAKAAAPIFTPGTAIYHSAPTVTITSTTPKATIYYTIDGTVPTTASYRYLGPIRVVKTTTFRAISTAVGYNPSSVTEAVYNIHLPALVTTKAANGILATQAILNSSINDESQAARVTYAYGTSQTALNKTTPVTNIPASPSLQSVPFTVTGLASKTTYYYQAVCQNLGGTVSGTVLSFTTK